MGYSFSLHDLSVSDGFNRIAVEQVARSILVAENPRREPAVRIHDVRKRCKKLRGLFRLAKPGFRDFAREDASIREVAASLTSARDTQVMLDTLDLIDKWRGVRERARRGPDESSAIRMAEENAALQRFRAAMQSVLSRAANWRLSGGDYRMLAQGLKTTYRAARRALLEAERTGTAEAFHRWRKLAKYHWHHLNLLQECTPAEFAALRESTLHLTELLGVHHDLAILSRSLTEAPGALKVELDVPDTLAAAHAMQKEVADEAFVLGAELFAERPRSFRKRFDKYFAVWRAQTAAAA